MSDFSYLIGNIHQAIEALISDGPQTERVRTACMHLFKMPNDFLNSTLSASSKESLKTIRETNYDDPESFRRKVQALNSFIVSAIQDTSEEWRKLYPVN